MSRERGANGKENMDVNEFDEYFRNSFKIKSF